jgi:peptidyl-prolyl cis-trans isomerase SurA
MRFSADKNSRNNGGIVVHPMNMSSKFEASMLPPDVSKVLTNLNIGEISDPFVTIDEKQRNVIQFVKLINRVDAHAANLSNDYPMLSDIFQQKKQEELILKWISERQSKTYIRIDDTYANCNFEFKNWIK